MNDEEYYSFDDLQNLVLKYQAKCFNLEKENKQLKERYETLKQEHIDTINRNEEKQQKIDKAIELLKKYGNGTFDEELLEILGDKEKDIEFDVLKALNTDLLDDIEMG